MNKKEKSLPKNFFEQFSNVDHFEKKEKYIEKKMYSPHIHSSFHIKKNHFEIAIANCCL